MTEFEFEIEGLEELEAALEELEQRWGRDDEHLVVTTVDYSVFLEFGTSKMDPKPFFRPAVDELRRSGVQKFLAQYGDAEFEDIDSTSELVEEVAKALRDRVKDIIERKGLIRTGTLHASITAVPAGEAGGAETRSITV
jgi:hypothetical protein